MAQPKSFSLTLVLVSGFCPVRFIAQFSSISCFNAIVDFPCAQNKTLSADDVVGVGVAVAVSVLETGVLHSQLKLCCE